MGKIFYIMGKSASGKDSIYSVLSEKEELKLQKLVLYTTRPIREGEKEGREYFFTDETKLREFEEQGKLIEARAYQTVHGVWTYFTADDGQVKEDKGNYLGIGTLESYRKMKEYYGEKVMCPVYIQVEDGGRFLEKSSKRLQSMRKCAGDFWRTNRIFPKKKSVRPGFLSGLKIVIWINVSKIL